MYKGLHEPRLTNQHQSSREVKHCQIIRGFGKAQWQVLQLIYNLCIVLQGNPMEVFSRSSHRQSDSSSLHGDAQNVGLEEAMRRARRPF